MFEEGLWEHFKDVREADPLKQGLKLHRRMKKMGIYESPRGRSTKTRIETTTHWYMARRPLSPRGRSTKTRIETGVHG